MNTAVISSIIGTVGAAFIAVLIFYLQGLRDDIRALGGRIDGVESGLRSDLGGRIDAMESRLGRVEESLIRIETVQEEHGRKLDGIADHGERISALEGAAAAMS
ncbi:MAG: hypothetical protein OXE75_06620 [bacterium]|nr:hypothetical protein [bacterium]